MGLNLNIRRIVLHTAVKKGKISAGPQYIDPSSIKQIAGRAGRLSSQYKVGIVTTWQNADLAYLKAVMAHDVPQISAIGLFPSVEQVKVFSELLTTLPLPDLHASDDSIVDSDPGSLEKNYLVVDSPPQSDKVPLGSEIRFSSVMSRLVDAAMIDGRYFMCEHGDIVVVANWLQTIPLSMEDRFIFSNSPANTRDSTSMNALYGFAAAYALKRPVAMNIRLPKYTPQNLFDFQDLCVKHHILDLYLWLSFRFPRYFVEQELCMKQRNYALSLIEKALSSSSLDQDYSHVQDYKKVRNRLLAKHPDSLPPDHENIRHIRSMMKDVLSTFEESKLYSL